MQAIERNVKAKPGAGHQHRQYSSSSKEARFTRSGIPLRSKQREDDCSAYDKLPKQIDDIV